MNGSVSRYIRVNINIFGKDRLIKVLRKNGRDRDEQIEQMNEQVAEGLVNRLTNNVSQIAKKRLGRQSNQGDQPFKVIVLLTTNV